MIANINGNMVELEELSGNIGTQSTKKLSTCRAAARQIYPAHNALPGVDFFWPTYGQKTVLYGQKWGNTATLRPKLERYGQNAVD